MAEATFHNGTKRNPDGSTADIEKLKETISSNRITRYTTILWTDGALSCDCPGWTIKKHGKPRECKHTKASVRCENADMLTPAEFTVEGNTVTTVQEAATMTSRERNHRGIVLGRRRM